ncbi:MAG: hypothetical protein JO257_08970 [Deltaproteobacteria bacterium]|nr:hypothetical protein [Deltaproteobacteria bacterium]
MWRTVMLVAGAIASLTQEVSKVRGLPAKKPIASDEVDRDELRARLVKLAADGKTADQLRAEGLALARWGLVPATLDYSGLMIDLMTDQIAGYYDPDTKTLTINKAAQSDPQWNEMVLAHEIDHGLQDQAFDLKAFEDVPDGEGDASLARHAVIEGDGIAVMLEVLLARQHVAPPWANPAVADELVRAMSAPTGDSLDKAPLAVREGMLFPYRDGFAFVAALRRRKPWSAIDAVFKRPPRSTEQILHPDKYARDEKPVPVVAGALPSLPDRAIVHHTVWGELGFSVFLRAHGVSDEIAREAAAGWGGDRAAVYAKAGDANPAHAVALARLQWDSEVDAIEAHDAAVRALDRTTPGATLDNTDLSTRWLALDGTVSFVERRGSAVMIGIGVPARVADAVISDSWTALH